MKNAYTEIDIDEAIAHLMTCACEGPCRLNEYWLMVLFWARDQRAMQRAQNIDHKSDPNEIAHYAPSWEVRTQLDWSAA